MDLYDEYRAGSPFGIEEPERAVTPDAYPDVTLDAGQAVLDAHEAAVESAADAEWPDAEQLDEQPELPEPVHPTVQQIDSLFASPHLDAAVARGATRLSRRIIEPDHITAEKNPHKTETTKAYNEVIIRHDAAAANLLEIMGHPEGEHDKHGSPTTTYRSWHYEERDRGDGTRVRLAHEVVVSNLDEGRNYPPNTLRSPSVYINSYVVYRQPDHQHDPHATDTMRSLKGVMQYDVIFEADVLTQHVERRDLTPRGHSYIASLVAEDICKEVRPEVLTPWAEAFMELPVPEEIPSPKHSYSEYRGYEPEGIHHFLTLISDGSDGQRLEDVKDVRSVFNTAFEDRHYAHHAKLLEMPFHIIDRLDEQHGAIAERYNWLISNADTIYADILRTEHVKAGVEFGARFRAKLQEEELRVMRLELLAEKLAAMRNINYCKPDAIG